MARGSEPSESTVSVLEGRLQESPQNQSLLASTTLAPNKARGDPRDPPVSSQDVELD